MPDCDTAAPPDESIGEGPIDEVPVDGTPVDEGPGCLPGVMAATVLMGIAFFVTCGGCTWFLFTKRSELALSTLRQNYIPELEQSLLAPEDKKEIVDALNQFADDLERGKYDDWQSTGVMTRMVRLPVLQWGELAFVERFAQSQESGFDTDQLGQFARLRRAVELDHATTIDFEDVLKPVVQGDENAVLGRSLMEPLTIESVQEVIRRAKLVSDRAKVPQDLNQEPSIVKIVQRQIQAGIDDGAI